VRFDMETKLFPNRPGDTLAPDAFVDILLKAIADAGMTKRVTVQSFDWRTLQLIQKLEPAIETVYLTIDTRNNSNVRDPAWTGGMLLRDHASVAHMVKASGATTWSPNYNNIEAADVKAGQKLGLKVIPWTVNEPADMDRLIAWGVDGIISDYPDRLRDAMRRAGLPLPRGTKN
jgi:glycerophosphoryl diester phosphodiesterase